MEKTKYNRVAEDKQQLQQFAEETIDKINAGIVEYVKAELSTSATFADLYELIGFDPSTASEVSKFNVDITIIGPGKKAKGVLTITNTGSGWMAELMTDVGADGIATYVWDNYQTTDTIYNFLYQHLQSAKVLVVKPANDESGKVLTSVGGGNMHWSAPAAGGTKLYKHFITVTGQNKYYIIISTSSAAFTSANDLLNFGSLPLILAIYKTNNQGDQYASYPFLAHVEGYAPNNKLIIANVYNGELATEIAVEYSNTITDVVTAL